MTCGRLHKPCHQGEHAFNGRPATSSSGFRKLERVKGIEPARALRVSQQSEGSQILLERVKGIEPARALRASQQSEGSQINLERVKGIEPSYAAWEAAVLPLNYTRERPPF
jgi:hypothetical protein